MVIYKKQIKIFFYIFLAIHLILWTVIPSLTNSNLPLDTIEALAWGSNLDWGFSKHPPMSALFVEIVYSVFGSNDWAYYLLSQIFIVFSFFIVFQLSKEILGNENSALVSVLLLEGIYFYNFTTPEFNVNVCQIPFWVLTVYYSWKIFNQKIPKFKDCILVGIFAAGGFLSKYLFIYLLISIDLFFIYLIFFKKDRKFHFNYVFTLEVFLVLLIPHIIWLFNNDFITITYGLTRSSADVSTILDHFFYPLIFVFKQVGILIPLFVMFYFLTKKFKLNYSLKDKNLLFLLSINILPIVLILLTSMLMGSKIRTMWMTPFYLFFGVFIVYLLKSRINFKQINSFLMGFLFLFFLSPMVYAYISISQSDKRTDYPGKEIALKTQVIWDQDFDKEIQFVTGDEWKAGNLSYHLKSRPKWEGLINDDVMTKSSQFICVDDVCLGRY